MRLIGSLANQQQAEAFAAYLLTQGIAAHLEKEKDDFEVWIKEEDALGKASSELEVFRANPDDKKYSDAISVARKLQEEEIRKRQRMAKNLVKVSGGKVPRNQSLTICLIAVCGFVALFTGFGRAEDRIKATYRALAFASETREDGDAVFLQNNQDRDAINWRLVSVKRGQIWRLVTPIFLHFGVLHILMNMYFLYMLGGQIEHRYGSFWFGLIVLAGAAIPNLVQCIVPESVGGSAPFYLGNYYIHGLGGMSGVNYALLGFVMMKMSYDRSSNLFIPQSTVFFLLGWMVFCMTPLAEQYFGLHVANWAHAIGLVVGLVIGYWPVLIGTSK